MNIYWGQLPLENGATYCATTEKGLCYIGTPNGTFQELEEWASKRFKNPILKHEESFLHPFLNELNAYLRGDIQYFTIPMAIYGTDFQKEIWRALCRIPYGETITYGELAQKINRPNAVRAVGSAVGANPLLYMIPCHRVVPKAGGLGGFRAGRSIKEQLLSIEQKSDDLT